MRKFTLIICTAALLAGLTGCNANEESSEGLSGTENSSEVSDSSGISGASDSPGNSDSSDYSDSDPKQPKPEGEPTFLTAPDGTPIYTSEISEVFRDGEIYGVREMIEFGEAERCARKGEGDFTVKCDGFAYGYVPERALNYVDDPEMFKDTGSGGYDFLGEKYNVITGEGECSTDFFRLNVGDKFGPLTVTRAYTLFSDDPELESFSDTPGAYISDCFIEFGGEIELTGYVKITDADVVIGSWGGDMEFFPDGDSSVKIPGFSYKMNRKTGEICHSRSALMWNSGDGECFGDWSFKIGNMFNVNCDTSGLHPGDVFVKVKVVLENINYITGGWYRVNLKSIDVI